MDFIANRSEFSASPTPSLSAQDRMRSPSNNLQQRYRQHQMFMRGTTGNIPVTVSDFNDNQVNKTSANAK